MARFRSTGRGWGRTIPSAGGSAASAGNAEPLEDGAGEGKDAHSIVSDVSRAIRTGIAPVANKVGSAVQHGVSSVGKALEDPTGAMSSEVLQQTDLPEIEGDNSLVSLGIRLDRESDLWRGIAMRQLARAGWMDRLSIMSAVIALIALLVLGSIAAFRALFGSDAGAVPALLLGVGAVLVGIGTLIVSRAAAKIRQSQLEVARDALARSDLAEMRLHRLAVLLEMRAVDADAYRAALRELEVEIRSA
jgi:hypothetical protein